MDWTQFHNPRTNDRGLCRRMIIVGAMFVAGFACVTGKLYWLHRIKAQEFAKEAENLRHVETNIPALRGSILDRDGELLAQDRTLHEVYADKKHLYDAKVILAPLALTLGITKADLARKMSEQEMVETYVRYVSDTLAAKAGMTPDELWKVLQPGGLAAPLLAKKLEKEDAKSWEDLLKTSNIKGVRLRSYTKRFLPAGDRVVNIVGLVNVQQNGVEGVEELMNVTLEGLDGYEEMEMDALRQRVLPGGVNKREEPKHGSHVVLTLDMDLQQYLEDVMLREHEKYKTQKAQAIIIDPSTGSILAMAGVPKFQPLPDGKNVERRNLIVTDIFEPGSTMKIFTVAAAMEAGVISSGSTIFCNNGIYEEPDNDVVLRDHVSLGYVTVRKIIEESSNIGAYKIAKKLGDDRFYAAIKNFGFGSKTALNMPRESSGIVKPLEKWSGTTLSRAAMGYEVSVTPLQLVMALGAIANHGTLMKPRLVESIISPDGNKEQRQPTVAIRQVCSARVAKSVTDMLEGVVTEGTGKQAAIEGVRVAGKTGTAKLYDPTMKGKLKYREGHYVVSFAGFAPADNPKLACVVVLTDPKVNDPSLLYGGKLAAPLFAEIMKEALTHMETAPQREIKMTLAGEGGAR